ncbi:hypothetical protein [Azospirillum sp.]|uniref:hypothetical protein n=1 Tax=Azospirillum sp. TaxID=34012 RepID=UPI0026102775|nr:hypothetical protein [Azospirillum sp.]
MTPETEAEMMRKLDMLLALAQAQGERIARMEGRLDEQSRILAALIPARLAAVPPAA